MAGLIFDPTNPPGLDWSTVGGRPDPRDPNVYHCMVTLRVSFNPKSYGNRLPPRSVVRTYTVTDMDTQILIRLDPAN